MKEIIKISRACGYLEKMYRQLNIDKFDGKLCQPVITIQSSPRTYGYVTCGKVWRVKDSQSYELNISAGTLDRPIENVVATLLHEMVHIYCLMNDIQDTSRGGTYHNKRFRERAERVGLVVEYDKRIGWSLTNPSEELICYVIDQGWTDILMNRQDVVAFVGTGNHGSQDDENDDAGKKKSSTRKYVCPHCGMSVRATRDVRIICADCAELMEKEG